MIALQPQLHKDLKVTRKLLWNFRLQEVDSVYRWLMEVICYCAQLYSVKDAVISCVLQRKEILALRNCDFQCSHQLSIKMTFFNKRGFVFMLMFVNEAPVSVRNFNLCWVNCTTPGFTWPAEPWHNWHFSVLAVGKIFLWGLILVLILFDHFYLWSGTYIKADSTSQHREGERHGKCYRSVYRIPICRNAESLSRSHAAARRAKEAHGFERLGPVLGNHLELQCGSVKTQLAKKKKKKGCRI